MDEAIEWTWKDPANPGWSIVFFREHRHGGAVHIQPQMDGMAISVRAVGLGVSVPFEALADFVDAVQAEGEDPNEWDAKA